MLYADTSAIVRAYFADEPEHEHLRALLLESDQRVLTSELARIEFARAVAAATRARRVRQEDGLLTRFDEDCRADGPLRLLELRTALVLPRAYRLVLEHGLGSLDALHLAVALDGRALAGDDPFVFVTRDGDQAAAAGALGLAVA